MAPFAHTGASSISPRDWATHQGAELDLLVIKHGRRIGVEIKRMDAPALTPSMRIALADLKLDRLIVLYPGTVTYSLGERVTAYPLSVLAQAGVVDELTRRGRVRG